MSLLSFFFDGLTDKALLLEARERMGDAEVSRLLGVAGRSTIDAMKSRAQRLTVDQRRALCDGLEGWAQAYQMQRLVINRLLGDPEGAILQELGTPSASPVGAKGTSAKTRRTGT